MSKHTKGPWYFSPADAWENDEDVLVQFVCYRISAGDIDGNDPRYYRIGEVSNINNSDQNKANARLIAAAPELLEALREILATLESEEDIVDGADGTPRPNAAMSYLAMHGHQMREAIAKATGNKQ